MKPIASLACILLFIFSAVAFSEEPRVNIPLGDSPQKGPKDAPVTIVEFLDFQ